jgi:hypothetical protein
MLTTCRRAYTSRNRRCRFFSRTTFVESSPRPFLDSIDGKRSLLIGCVNSAIPAFTVWKMHTDDLGRVAPAGYVVA